MHFKYSIHFASHYQLSYQELNYHFYVSSAEFNMLAIEYY
jgi:hypothetical protein